MKIVCFLLYGIVHRQGFVKEFFTRLQEGKRQAIGLLSNQLSV
jgi:hypothetical protein